MTQICRFGGVAQKKPVTAQRSKRLRRCSEFVREAHCSPSHREPAVLLNADATAVEQSGSLEEHSVIRIVAGLPLDLEGEIGKQAKKVLAFLDVLRTIVDVDVLTQDERFSTASAARRRPGAHQGHRQGIGQASRCRRLAGRKE